MSGTLGDYVPAIREGIQWSPTEIEECYPDGSIPLHKLQDTPSGGGDYHMDVEITEVGLGSLHQTPLEILASTTGQRVYEILCIAINTGTTTWRGGISFGNPNIEEGSHLGVTIAGGMQKLCRPVRDVQNATPGPVWVWANRALKPGTGSIHFRVYYAYREFPVGGHHG